MSEEIKYEEIAVAIANSGKSIVQVDKVSFSKIGKTQDEMVSFFRQVAAPEHGIEPRSGRCHNLPTVPDAVAFLISHAKFTRDDLEKWVNDFAEYQAPDFPQAETAPEVQA